ncbi:hypothetical protein DV451_004369 [Geotrichum candidum]|uniref:Similar to Saccharomyces cerevisiae YJR044C VPS55 Late endosomal protein involved in late endosome to vacuole trafficking n=1 Tax=Geotrichum candidum TaxID=1173061 RepID=A0A0J9X7Z0_GEOCN|nr:hypothetical protein DV451_004369 [Geotrichum candidum]KAF5111608.1 hypothetical protein DV453_000253 [Geotrichum candidum]KAF5112817.1 hypothetical protein DV454_004005 [Geotrichum candidum]KAF5123047.1 hypothetical protein DV452_000367 [Geotrichum candidum]KAF5126436.1 hypothetical protein DV495_003554 [Geotrichum candidum]
MSFTVSPLAKIITLASTLALGFILIILSCALYNNWVPLTVVGIFLLAPVPNALCGKWDGNDDFMSETSTAVLDFGRFFTGFLVFSGIALPIVLAHNSIIGISAMAMSLVGGFIIYGTIVTFSAFFHQSEEF